MKSKIKMMSKIKMKRKKLNKKKLNKKLLKWNLKKIRIKINKLKKKKKIWMIFLKKWDVYLYLTIVNQVKDE